MDFPGRDIFRQAVHAYRSASAVEKLRRALETLARGTGGATVRDNYTDAFPRVRMNDAGRVRWLSLNRAPGGQMRVGLVSRSLLEEAQLAELPSLELHPAWRGRDFVVPWMRPVMAGDAVLDARFALYSAEGKTVAHVFTRPVCEAILALHYGFDIPGVDVALGGRSIVLRKTVRSDRVTASLLQELLARMDVVCRAVEEVFRIDAEGIFHIDQSGSPEAESRCRVCGELLDESPLYCAACETPHHTDCWQYLGRCAIFGCGSHRFLARKARDASDLKPTRRPPVLLVR
ncbi:MAG: hypothetical protein HY303_20475 [Candidatus Wallbacteria bacterium]|nr:hypothetical protein [Candidatus Wallbacteria bacterium]